MLSLSFILKLINGINTFYFHAEKCISMFVPDPRMWSSSLKMQSEIFPFNMNIKFKYHLISQLNVISRRQEDDYHQSTNIACEKVYLVLRLRHHTQCSSEI